MSDEREKEQESVQQEILSFLTALGQKFRETATKSSYANYANFEISELDLKFLFGQLNQQAGKGSVDWHTAVTVGWPEAKLISFYLRVNLAIYESTHETIKIPAAMLPPAPPAPEDLTTNTVSKKIFEATKSLHKELMDDQLPLWPKVAE